MARALPSTPRFSHPVTSQYIPTPAYLNTKKTRLVLFYPCSCVFYPKRKNGVYLTVKHAVCLVPYVASANNYVYDWFIWKLLPRKLFCIFTCLVFTTQSNSIFSFLWHNTEKHVACFVWKQRLNCSSKVIFSHLLIHECQTYGLQARTALQKIPSGLLDGLLECII